jgi:hypothetical protein
VYVLSLGVVSKLSHQLGCIAIGPSDIDEVAWSPGELRPIEEDYRALKKKHVRIEYNRPTLATEMDVAKFAKVQIAEASRPQRREPTDRQKRIQLGFYLIP